MGDVFHEQVSWDLGAVQPLEMGEDLFFHLFKNEPDKERIMVSHLFDAAQLLLVGNGRRDDLEHYIMVEPMQHGIVNLTRRGDIGVFWGRESDVAEDVINFVLVERIPPVFVGQSKDGVDPADDLPESFGMSSRLPGAAPEGSLRFCRGIFIVLFTRCMLRSAARTSYGIVLAEVSGSVKHGCGPENGFVSRRLLKSS